MSNWERVADRVMDSDKNASSVSALEHFIDCFVLFWFVCYSLSVVKLKMKPQTTGDDTPDA